MTNSTLKIEVYIFTVFAHILNSLVFFSFFFLSFFFLSFLLNIDLLSDTECWIIKLKHLHEASPMKMNSVTLFLCPCIILSFVFPGIFLLCQIFAKYFTHSVCLFVRLIISLWHNFKTTTLMVIKFLRASKGRTDSNLDHDMDGYESFREH